MRDLQYHAGDGPEEYAGRFEHDCTRVTEHADGSITCDECRAELVG